MRTGRSHILELLRSIGPVAEQIQRQGRQDGILGEIRALLPVSERPHCIAAVRQGPILTLTVDTAAWGTRIRYRIPNLLSALGPSGIVAIKTRIQPSGQGALVPYNRRAHSGPSTHARLSATAANHLLAAADEIGDPGLAEVLRRLARRHRGGGTGP